jgi:hypothetical protein
MQNIVRKTILVSGDYVRSLQRGFKVKPAAFHFETIRLPLRPCRDDRTLAGISYLDKRGFCYPAVCGTAFARVAAVAWGGVRKTRWCQSRTAKGILRKSTQFGGHICRRTEHLHTYGTWEQLATKPTALLRGGGFLGCVLLPSGLRLPFQLHLHSAFRQSSACA